MADDGAGLVRQTEFVFYPFCCVLKDGGGDLFRRRGINVLTLIRCTTGGRVHQRDKCDPRYQGLLGAERDYIGLHFWTRVFHGVPDSHEYPDSLMQPFF